MTYLTVDERDAETIGDALTRLLTGAGAVRHIGHDRSRIEYDERPKRIYSYGRHFPLVHVVLRGPRTRPLFILNGDRAPARGGMFNRSRTPDHQSVMRRLCSELGDTILIPFSALEGAAIDIDSIRPIEVRDDRNWTETHYADTLAQVPRWAREVWHPGRRGADGLWTEGYSAPIAPGPDGRYSWTTHEHRLGDSLFSAVRDGRRATFLSSFDYNERAPLYFLVQVPRGARAESVDAAIESLAPRAVHAAYARGLDVRRQGDVFFIPTRLTAPELETRGIIARARLTQWTRDARPRKGEAGYSRPLNARERRRMARYAREQWTAIIAEHTARVTAGYSLGDRESWQDRCARRARRAAQWRAMQTRHTLERDLAAMTGAELTAPLSTACAGCGAPVGAACPDRYRRACYGRESLERAQRAELERYRSGARGRVLPGPTTDRGARAKWAKKRAEHARELERAEHALRRAILGAPDRYGRPASRYDDSYRYSAHSPLTRERTGIAERARRARENVEHARGRVEATARGRATARDAYRRPFANPLASQAWLIAWQRARERFIPAEHAPDAIRRRRELARRALAIYGTAHSATEVIRTRTGTYARGIVRHVPELEPGRRGAPDHRPLELAPDVWYLAIRNAVPRQRVRRAA